MAIATTNPATGITLRRFEALSDAQIDAKLQLAVEAFDPFRQSSFADRAVKMRRVAELLDERSERYGDMAVLEMGKPRRAAIEEVKKCATVCRYYADHAEQQLADETVETSADLSYIRYQPLGAILAVMPWNFPFWQMFRFAAPALMAGNVGLLKHASNVPQCALAIEEVFRDGGFPEGVLQTLLVGSDKVEMLLQDSRVKAATLTGSEAAGSKVATIAGKNVKKTVLELGGSDPFIVMPSANLGEAVKTAVQARTINNGQSCIAAKRFIIHEEIADEFEKQFVERMKSLKIGDPMKDDTDIGPLATADIRDGLHEQVQKSVAAGARLLTGGQPLDQPGYYYPPTVLIDIPRDSPAYKEELFGPVACLFRIKDIEEAINLANDTIFGLGSSVWTNVEEERLHFIERIEAGCVFVNAMVASNPQLPFGGVKQSGYGRELSAFGIREFVNIKTVWINEAGKNGSSATD